MGNGVYFNQKGEWKNTFNFLAKNRRLSYQEQILRRYAEEGLNNLREATPVDSGVTADSWYYEIDNKGYNSWSITYYNSNVNNGFSVVIGLQYGHATGNGGWVQGHDFINPAIQSVFDKIAQDAWAELTSV